MSGSNTRSVKTFPQNYSHSYRFLWQGWSFVDECRFKVLREQLRCQHVR